MQRLDVDSPRGHPHQNSPRGGGGGGSPRWPALEQASRERQDGPPGRERQDGPPQRPHADQHAGAALRDASRHYERLLGGEGIRHLSNTELSVLHAAHLRMLQILQDAEWQRCQET